MNATAETREVEHVSILEYTEESANYGRTPGEKVILGGVRKNQHVRDEDKESFVEVADGVAVIELHEPIPEDDVTDWCNSQAGKLALSHWFDHTDPEDVVMTDTPPQADPESGGEQQSTEVIGGLRWSLRHGLIANGGWTDE
jgi:hypothetical protein